MSKPQPGVIAVTLTTRPVWVAAAIPELWDEVRSDFRLPPCSALCRRELPLSGISEQRMPAIEMVPRGCAAQPCLASEASVIAVIRTRS